MKIFLVSVLLLITFSSTHAMEFSRQDDTVTLQGLIQTGDYEKFLPLAKNATRVLITSSPGGNAEEALKIAEFIETEKIKVQVAGPCMSACASILLLASSSRQIDEHGLLVYHSGTAGLVEKMVSDLESLPASAKKLPFYQTAIH